MRDLMVVFSYEWVKLVRRKNFWIAIVLALLMPIGISYTSYYNMEHALRKPEEPPIKEAIALEEKYLRELEQEWKKAQNREPSTPSIGEQPQVAVRSAAEIQSEIERVKQRLKDLKKQLQKEQEWKRDWKKVVRKDITRLQEDSKKKYDFGTIVEIKAKIKMLQYRLDHNLKPVVLKEEFYTSAYRQISHLSGFAAFLFVPLIVVILVVGLASQDPKTGSMKHLLARPISHTRILLGKWLVSLGATIVIVTLFHGSLILTNLGFYGTKGANEPQYVGINYIHTHDDPPPESAGYDRYFPIPDYEEAEIRPIWQVVVYGALLQTYAMLTVATIVLLCSTLFRSSWASFGVAFAVVVLGSILTQMNHNGKLIGWLFTVHYNPVQNWIGEISEFWHANLPLSFSLVTMSIWMIISLVMAWVVFKRRNYS